MIDSEQEVFCNLCKNRNTDIASSLFPENVSLAMAYVPYQKWQNIYAVDDGFEAGTIFADLDLPFLGAGKEKRR